MRVRGYFRWAGPGLQVRRARRRFFALRQTPYLYALRLRVHGGITARLGSLWAISAAAAPRCSGSSGLPERGDRVLGEHHKQRHSLADAPGVFPRASKRGD